MSATLLTLLLSAAWAGQGAEIIGTATPVDGVGRAQIVVTDIGVRSSLVADPPTATFAAVVGTGGARVTRTEWLPATNKPQATVLAFDASGSFRPYWSGAFALGEAFADNLPTSGNIVDVVTFGTSLAHHGDPGGTTAEVQASLDAAERIGSDQRATRLKGFVHDAIAAAAQRQPSADGGARQVIVFTDGGDESDAYDVDALVDDARQRGVRVHVVAMHAQSRTSPQRLDEIKRLAERTGGLYIQGDDTAAARAQIATLARAGQGTFWIDLAFCGATAGAEHSTDQLSLEVQRGGQRVAFTDAVDFRQHNAGAALTACSAAPAPAPVPAPAVGTDNVAVPEPADTTSNSQWPWIAGLCAGLSLLGLLGLLGLLALWRNRKRQEPDDEPVIAEAPPEEPAPEPTTDRAVAAAAPWRDPFDTLPERHLRLVRGGKGLESFYRVHCSPFVIGGDRSLSPELLIDLPQVSGRHCSLQVYKNGSVWVTDEHSTNGTFIDGRRLTAGERAPLQPGQRLGISRHVEMVLEDPSLHTPSAPPTPEPKPAPEPEPEKKRRNRTVYNPVKNRDDS